VIQTLLIDRSNAARLYARPGDREAVALQIELLYDGDIFLVAVLVVAGDVGCGPPDLAGCVHEAIPDRLTPFRLPSMPPRPEKPRSQFPRESLWGRAERLCQKRLSDPSLPAIPRSVLEASRMEERRRRLQQETCS
jgi:hypothetical protein